MHEIIVHDVCILKSANTYYIPHLTKENIFQFNSINTNELSFCSSPLEIFAITCVEKTMTSKARKRIDGRV